ncbi:pre-mRNA splicing factor [Pochonia chlamydosporia 170]|uniref:Pre-mRNA splicing factor n=1 Tax=Pochonia chlamydosporia 170 TaxID=1380566 RepID=A0A179FZS0_METCM|nr:pre-mRNA splicing factor [Pochonia chlamydosporia 170]OAQ70690.1 pre-mRNA splicing factor [Pochonia chlamydosporia 170]
MTQVYVYSSALVAFAAATAMIVASIFIPNWVSYSVTTPKGDIVEKHIGLHKSCSNLDSPTCKEFPTADLCQAGERYFCDMWKTVGFMASLAAIMCLASLVCFLVVMRGGKYKRETGWPFVSGMLTLVSVVEFVIISLVAYLYDNDDQFTIPGWNLDVSWYISTASAAISLLAAAGLAVSAYLLPPEDGYDFLEDSIDA